MSIQQEVRNSWHDSIVELFELDLEPITEDANDKYYFTGDIFPDGTKIQWQGEVYEPFPISITGFETTTKGTIPQPELTVANVLGTLAAATNAFDDLVGAKITRRRTLGKYLDNGTNPDASEEFPIDVYYIERKTSETSLSISWQLASKIDLEGLQIPRRIVTQNYCVWKYRGTECGYDGPPLANDRDGPLVGDGSAASANYINAQNAFSVARSAQRNAEYVLNLASGQVAANCDIATLPVAETYSKLTGPDYSFAIVVSGQPLFGVVEGGAVDITSPSADYRATRSVRGSFEDLVDTSGLGVGNSIGPLRQIDLWQEVAVEGGGTSLQVVDSFYSETAPISFTFPESSGTSSRFGATSPPQIGIVNGGIVPIVTNGAGYRAGSQRKASLNGIYSIGLIDKNGTLCGISTAELSAAEAALATANSQLSAAQATLTAATAALPNTSELFQQDVCGKRLNSCKLRFGTTELPFGAFPGANLSR
jgi:lambda family phage minor tail protein L